MVKNKYSHIFTPGDVYNHYNETGDPSSEEIWNKLLEKNKESDLLSMSITIGDIAKIVSAREALSSSVWFMLRSERRYIIQILLMSLNRVLAYTSDYQIHACMSLLNAISKYKYKHTKEHVKTLLENMPKYEIGDSLHSSNTILRYDVLEFEEGIRRSIFLIGNAIDSKLTGWRYQLAVVLVGKLVAATLEVVCAKRGFGSVIDKELAAQVDDVCSVFPPIVFK